MIIWLKRPISSISKWIRKHPAGGGAPAPPSACRRSAIRGGRGRPLGPSREQDGGLRRRTRRSACVPWWRGESVLSFSLTAPPDDGPPSCSRACVSAPRPAPPRPGPSCSAPLQAEPPARAGASPGRRLTPLRARALGAESVVAAQPAQLLLRTSAPLALRPARPPTASARPVPSRPVPPWPAEPSLKPSRASRAPRTPRALAARAPRSSARASHLLPLHRAPCRRITHLRQARQ